MKTYTISTSKNLQLDFNYGMFVELSKKIINEAFAGHKIGYVSNGCMEWKRYTFDAVIDGKVVEATIDYASKTCSFSN